MSVSSDYTIQVEALSKTFVTRSDVIVHTLKDVDLSVKSGEFITILGPSGCGKTTILNIIARIQAPTSGRVLINGQALESARFDIGYVFQQDTVLPWRKVSDNIALGLLIRGVPAAERARRVGELIELTGLQGFEQAFPTELSGGMRKRVALATALAFDPPILLMDEPFGALDAQTRLSLQEELMNIWSQTRKTVLFVTHDISEAIILADRVIVMTARPAAIKSVWNVAIPRPRRMDEVAVTPTYQKLFGQLWAELRPEVVTQSKVAATQ